MPLHPLENGRSHMWSATLIACFLVGGLLIAFKTLSRQDPGQNVESLPSPESVAAATFAPSPKPRPTPIPAMPAEPRLTDTTFPGSSRAAAPELETELKGGGTPPEGFERIKVFFGTNRGRKLGANLRRPFDTTRGPMVYGVCEVSIPPRHEKGELEAPTLFRFEFREDPTKHIVLLDFKTLEKGDFLTELKAKVGSSSRKAMFVFIHGYNVTFEDAARRTAQISYDLDYDGAPVFFSWPSAESIAGYGYDKESIRWAQPYLESFLRDVARLSDAEHIHLIAHSMGTQILTEALRTLRTEEPDLRARFREIILTAPDIDATVFKEQIAPMLSEFGAGVTIYASSSDKALIASKKYQGYPRLGDTSEGIVVMPGFDTIDATRVSTSFLGHSYFASEKSILSDMFDLLGQGIRAAQRSDLKRTDTASGPYWVMVR